MFNLTNSAKRIQLDRLQAEYERLDKVLLEVIADMAVLKYELDLLETTENWIHVFTDALYCASFLLFKFNTKGINNDGLQEDKTMFVQYLSGGRKESLAFALDVGQDF